MDDRWIAEWINGWIFYEVDGVWMDDFMVGTKKKENYELLMDEYINLNE